VPNDTFLGKLRERDKGLRGKGFGGVCAKRFGLDHSSRGNSDKNDLRGETAAGCCRKACGGVWRFQN